VHRDLVLAAREGQSTIRLEYLLSRGAGVDAEDKIGLTALYHAAFQGDNENVRFLVDHGADVNSEHHLLGTPIAVAALRGHSGVVETLLQHKADILNSLPGLGSALHCACFGGNSVIFRSILHASKGDCLAGYREVYLKAFSVISTTSLKPAGIYKLLRKERDFQRLITCSPILLAAERCHFDILRLCWSEFHYDYLSIRLWGFPDGAENATHNDRPHRRSKASWASIESRSGPSYASTGSTSSAWSTLGFPLAAREQPRFTLLMWAAASLNLPLIIHLLEAGASAKTTDELGQTALHYAAAPFFDATFENVEECVRLLLVDQASPSSQPSIRIAHDPPPPTRFIKSPLDLVVSSDHAALDPRTSYKWGLDIHRTCISSFLDPLATNSERSDLAQRALPHALSHNMCPIDSIKLLFEHAVGSGGNICSRTESGGIDKALCHALEISAAEPIIIMLLDHGANPNAAYHVSPLHLAISSKASEAVVIALLQHGADPDFRSGPQILTPNERAKQSNRQDLIDLFARHKTTSKLPDLTRNHPAAPRAGEVSTCRIQDPQSLGSLAVLDLLDDLDEVDELDELDDLDMDTLGYQFTNDSGDSVGPSRQWLLGIPSYCAVSKI
jgi:ankyrin repeat protein